MPRPTQRITSLPPFSHHARQSLDDSSLPTLPHPPSPPSDPTAAGVTSGGLSYNFHRYSAIPLIPSVAAETDPNEEAESFSYMNNLNTGAYNSLNRTPSYRLPSPVSLPSRHNSRIQRDRGMSASPVSSISAADAPITSRYSYLIQPSAGMSQNPTSSEISYPSLPSQEQNPTISTMGLPPSVDHYGQGQSSRFQGQLTTINESTTNLPGTSNHGNNNQSMSQLQYAAPPPPPPPAPTVTYDLPPRPQFPSAGNTLPTPPQNTFQRLRSTARSRFGRIPNIFIHRGPPRPLSLSYLLRRRTPSNHPPTPALAIVGLVTSVLVFISLMTFLWVSTFAANIVAIVYSFSVLVACTWVLVDYSQKKMKAREDEEAGGSRSSFFASGGGTRQELDMVQESEIIVIPRIPVHRVVGEGEADPELPPYSRGDAAEILDIPVPPPPHS